MPHILIGKTLGGIIRFNRVFGFNYKQDDYWGGTNTLYLCTKQMVKLPSYLQEEDNKFLQSFCGETITEVLEYKQECLYINEKLFPLPRESKFLFTDSTNLASKYDENRI